MKRKSSTLFLIPFVLLPTLVFCQKNEVSFSVGAIFTSDQSATPVPGLPLPCPLGSLACNNVTQFKTDPGIALEGAYARRVVGAGPAALYAELVFAGIPGRNLTVSSAPPGQIPVDITTFSSSAFFFTPSAKLKLLGSSPVSPFLSFGGGLAHLNNGFNNNNVGALQAGGGLDFKTPIPLLRFRVEVRDFYTGSGVPSSSQATVSPRWVNHVFVGGGTVLRF